MSALPPRTRRAPQPKSATVNRNVADRLRKAIVSGELPAGSRIVQSDIAARLGVSVTPVREALRELEAEGLVDFDAYRGATIHQTCRAELIEVYELRKTLIPSSVAAAVMMLSDEELDEAEFLARSMTMELPAEEWVEANRRFHWLMDTTSELPRTRTILGNLTDLSTLYVGLAIGSESTRRERAQRDHLSMVEIARRRDVDAAVEIAVAHLHDTLTSALKSMDG
ncbi:GntR family transcriptional regulator [Gordonia sp. HNM0687]|uniref:GntR family transcriptional regulator n=1 Tax=Gordonia mangrovi TaxID=2665643 RepID=A0A6L7GJJ9_9ACTN|nr:GntR family transcriptional regulator [Gordonia mangrovi]MXP20109.1 GntR family transcriptional regulator [Gordonia mangrovi]UVF79281.1 GntR family transcriptional regulator [Gordonia mangrovi]